MRKAAAHLLTAIPLLLTAGCLHSAAASAPEQGHWRLMAAGTAMLDDQAPPFSIELGENPASVSGSLACNRWNGKRVSAPDSFSVTVTSSTRRRCNMDNPEWKRIEQEFLRRLVAGATTSLQGSDWVFTFSDGVRWTFRQTP